MVYISLMLLLLVVVVLVVGVMPCSGHLLALMPLD